MIGLDTNVLVRYLMQDDVVQSASASALIERLTARQPGFISVVAIAETAWVLRRSYRQTPVEIASAIERLLQSNPIILVEAEQAVFKAMTALREGRGSFGDALIAELGRRAGCGETVTFDRRASRLPGFAML